MIPVGDLEDTKGNGCADIDALVLPRGGFGGSTVVLWTPVARSDIAWNFEVRRLVAARACRACTLPRTCVSMHDHEAHAQGRRRRANRRAAAWVLPMRALPCRNSSSVRTVPL